MSALALAVMAAGALAAKYSHAFVINLKSGTTVEYQFSEQPVATFVGDDMSIQTKGGEKLLQPIAEITNITFVATETGGIDGVAATGSDVVVRFDGSVLHISGLEAGSDVRVFTVGGTMCRSAVADEAGILTVAVGDLNAGVYVVASKEHSFKFVKK